MENKKLKKEIHRISLFIEDDWDTYFSAKTLQVEADGRAYTKEEYDWFYETFKEFRFPKLWLCPREEKIDIEYIIDFEVGTRQVCVVSVDMNTRKGYIRNHIMPKDFKKDFSFRKELDFTKKEDVEFAYNYLKENLKVGG